MSGFDTQEIRVRARAKSNGLTSVVVGCALLLCSFLWFSIMPGNIDLPGFFLASAAIISLLIGWFKIREPDHSIVLTPEQIHYRHRLGSWYLSWKNIQRVDQPRVARGLEHVPLEMVGIKIRDYKTFITSISPRLATHLLMEQRPLLLQSHEASCSSGACSGSELVDGTRYKLPGGEVLTGVQAMLANRMNRLREGLGYDVFVAGTELDREPQQFVKLLRDCLQSNQVDNL